MNVFRKLKNNRIRLISLLLLLLWLPVNAQGVDGSKVQEIYDRFPLLFTPGEPGLEAHRGLIDSYPENTVPAFEAAGREPTVKAIETDLQVTSDGYFVCMHDETLDRTTNGSGLISSHTMAEISGLTIIDGTGWSDLYAGQLSVPTLEEFLSICRQYEKVPYLELKELSESDVDRLISYLDENGWASRAVLISFHLSLLERASRLSRDYPLQYMPSGGETYETSIAKIKDIPNMAYRPKYSDLTPEVVSACRAAGLLVECYNMPDGDEEARKKLVAMGVDGITCNSASGLSFSPWVQPKMDISGLALTLSQTEYIYDGTVPAPDVTVTQGNYILKPEEDYTLSPMEAGDAGEHTVTVTGTGRYCGTLTGSYRIAPKDISGCAPSLSQTQYTYDGKSHRPTASLSDGAPLIDGVDYTVSYGSGIGIGRVPVVFTGIGNYQGTLETSYEILPMDIHGLTPRLGYTSMVETGQSLCPIVSLDAVDLHLIPGTDFTVTYANNVEPGFATVTITGIGSFTGTITTSFEILKDQRPYYLAAAGGGLSLLLLLLLMIRMIRKKRRRKHRR